ncbi:NAD-dependent epimerase/dehydratase family protein [Glacieibacterium frigidum]|uniref:NAD-dependent epimerase/dehydratase family protein n=1 Tax=Glacieibacterium frigidum TaxID=2593303 RepID=UPI00163DBD9F|nr:NAD(P)-dependent oxidoreductase [Glacieibacterium frigidum]
MSRVLVTGGPGFIGRRVVQRFLSAGWDVTSFSLPGEPPIAGWSAPVRMVHGDLADRAAVADAARGCELAIHLAAPVGVAGRYQWQWDTIVEGTRHVCEAVAAQGGRAVVASSIAVYGTLIQTRTCREDDGHGPWAGAYGRAKQGQEQIALEIAARTGMALTLVRPANVYGVGGASAWGDKLLDAFAATGGAVFGAAERNDAGLVYVENLADALFLAGTSDAAVGRTYNVCDGSGVTWQRFADDMAAIVDRPPPPAIPLADMLAAVAANEDPAELVEPRDPALPSLEGLNLVGFDNRIDASRIRRELGWQPRVTYEDALGEIRAGYRQAATLDTCRARL